MKKIPTLFKRKFENGKLVGITNEFNDGFDENYWMYCRATVKMDGSCCAIINGKLYKRYDAKKGKKPPEGAIPCCEPDKITGHHPHWVELDENNPADKWFFEAFKNTGITKKNAWMFYDGTYEALGPHFNGNPYNKREDKVFKHGLENIGLKDWSFEGIKEYLRTHEVEGIVFWTAKNGKNIPIAKIKRTDFGFEWPIKN